MHQLKTNQFLLKKIQHHSLIYYSPKFQLKDKKYQLYLLQSWMFKTLMNMIQLLKLKRWDLKTQFMTRMILAIKWITWLMLSLQGCQTLEKFFLLNFILKLILILHINKVIYDEIIETKTSKIHLVLNMFGDMNAGVRTRNTQGLTTHHCLINPVMTELRQCVYACLIIRFRDLKNLFESY